MKLIMIKKALTILNYQLIAFFEGCLEYSIFPNEWKVANMIILLKASEKDPIDPGSYRPICPLSILPYEVKT